MYRLDTSTRYVVRPVLASGSPQSPSGWTTKSGEIRVYVVEVCQSCAWSHLAMLYVPGHGSRAPGGRRTRRNHRPPRPARALTSQDVPSPCTCSSRSPARAVRFGRRTAAQSRWVTPAPSATNRCPLLMRSRE
ncbi:hypothetical protein ETD83_36725 [Actinomadura soli]|uniref:Uncharacterized protein n=1 Tax=Actinomadura soli TaxID=2508997 RepID=A0A5C4J0X7_9ACTN|nr:hypothetical protein ETD83_36725 [Actinomadura soli]